jgi:hypothetical protein
MSSLIATYNYYYSSGIAPNRRIEFYRDDTSQSIYAIIKACMGHNNWKEISILKGKKILVEIMTTSEKIEGLVAQKKGLPFIWKPDQQLSKLELNKQDDVLRNLEPEGPWRIEIANGVGNNLKFEKVLSLTIFNPT